MQVLVERQDPHRKTNIACQLKDMLSREGMDAGAVFRLKVHVNRLSVANVSRAIEHAVVELYGHILRLQLPQLHAGVDVCSAAHFNIAVAYVHIQYIHLVPNLVEVPAPIHEGRRPRVGAAAHRLADAEARQIELFGVLLHHTMRIEAGRQRRHAVLDPANPFARQTVTRLAVE